MYYQIFVSFQAVSAGMVLTILDVRL